MNIPVAFYDTHDDPISTSFVKQSSDSFYRVSSFKFSVIQTILRLGVNVLYSDSDIIIYHNPIPVIQSTPFNSSIFQKDMTICTGFFYMEPTPLSFDLMKRALVYIQEKHKTDQGSLIRTFKDLKGKTLSVGAPGGTMHLDFFRWVEANGLDPKKDFGKVLFLPASEAMEAVKTGQVDVAVELSSIPSPQISELSILRPVHILEFLPGARADMMQKYPQYLPTTIEKGAYNGIDQPIETVGTGAMFACRADLPDDLVYEIVKTVYSQEGVDYLGNVIAALKSMSPNLAVSYKPIPLHPGAERYFREIGLIKD